MQVSQLQIVYQTLEENLERLMIRLVRRKNKLHVPKLKLLSLFQKELSEHSEYFVRHLVNNKSAHL